MRCTSRVRCSLLEGGWYSPGIEHSLSVKTICIITHCNWRSPQLKLVERILRLWVIFIYPSYFIMTIVAGVDPSWIYLYIYILYTKPVHNDFLTNFNEIVFIYFVFLVRSHDERLVVVFPVHVPIVMTMFQKNQSKNQSIKRLWHCGAMKSGIAPPLCFVVFHWDRIVTRCVCWVFDYRWNHGRSILSEPTKMVNKHGENNLNCLLSISVPKKVEFLKKMMIHSSLCSYVRMKI